MSDTVVDSSVVAKWILPEPDSTQAQRLITDIALKGERLVILDLVFPEVANAINNTKGIKRHIATVRPRSCMIWEASAIAMTMSDVKSANTPIEATW